ncbi:hypothetical protein J3R30DRAFT_3449544 [Lentinula aciculospora]|uniref:Secreted protein n=1 Tax=Lentinula aciculospora TaxID=153920 RepID=A0A9W9AKH3_9AGAR|nr:hypothetical protein J3R30DRAFT_3449544 [Lentinula aciculospora]
MMNMQIIIASILFLAAGISNVTSMPGPIDPGLQRVVAEKNGMGVVVSYPCFPRRNHYNCILTRTRQNQQRIVPYPPHRLALFL